LEIAARLPLFFPRFLNANGMTALPTAADRGWRTLCSGQFTSGLASLGRPKASPLIQLVDANRNVFPGQVTLTFTVPNYDRAKVYGHGH
jgi:hypothetical protein